MTSLGWALGQTLRENRGTKETKKILALIECPFSWRWTDKTRSNKASKLRRAHSTIEGGKSYGGNTDQIKRNQKL